MVVSFSFIALTTSYNFQLQYIPKFASKYTSWAPKLFQQEIKYIHI